MHIEESATHQFEYETSSRCAQSLKQEQMQAPKALENCLDCDENRFNSKSTEIALANCDLGIWDWNLLTNSFKLANFDPLYSLGESSIGTHLISGYEPAEIPDYQTFERLIHPHDLLQVRQARQDYFENRTPLYEVEFRILTKSALWKWVVERGRVIEYDSGKPSHIVGTHRDITKEKFLAAALHQHETREQLLKRVREIIDSSWTVPAILQATVEQVQQFLHIDRVLIYCIYPNNDIVVADSHITDNSIKYDRYQDCDKADLVTPILHSFFDFKAVQPQSDNINNETNLWGMLIAHNCGDECKWQEWEIDTLKQVSREIEILIARTQLLEQIQVEVDTVQVAQTQIQDISQELERIQKQLIYNEKLSSIGQLLSNVVNEIYNPVSFIDDSLTLVSRYAEDVIEFLEAYQQHYNLPPAVIASKPQYLDLNFIKTDLLKMLWSMRAGSERLKETVFALHDFLPFDNGEMKKADLHSGLNNALIILQHRLKQQPNKPGIEVIRKFAEIPLVNCFQSELNQVFINILTNAIEALEERMKYDYSFLPKICISTEIVNSYLTLVSNNNQQPTPRKHKIIIRISDNGTGILPHMKRRIFEPFFTTKSISSKGLGLSISEEIIVQNHHGKLYCNSQLGQGTEFIIEINTTPKRYTNTRKPVNF